MRRMKETHMKKHKAMIFVTILLVFSLTVSLSFADEPNRQYGGTLRLSDQTDGVSIGYPPKLVRIYANKQVAPAVETLVRTDRTGKPVPWLAAGWRENAKDKTLTLSLRKGIQFHDGTDFNAQAVKWNLDQCMAGRASGTEKFRSVDAIDDYTVRINLSEWDSTVTSNLALTIGMMVSPTAYKKNGEQWSANHPVGTGPFEFISWEKDVRTVYRKFPGYWQKGKPYLDRVEWIPIADALTRQLSLRRGELDLALTIAAKDIESLSKGGFVVTKGKTGSGAATLVPDSANPNSPFSDVKVRQAAQHAIDTQAIAKAVFFGEAEPANQWIYKGHWGYNPSVVGYPYDPAKAKQLLTEAGYPSGFKTRLLYRTTAQEDQFFTAVQGYLKMVGINAELDPVQNARWNQVAWEGGKWEGLVMGGLMGSPDVAASLATMYCGGGMYYTQMALPDDYAKAIRSAITAADFNTKQQYTQEVMKLMVDKYALQIMLVCQSFFAASTPILHDHGFYSTPNSAWWTPEEAWLDKR